MAVLGTTRQQHTGHKKFESAFSIRALSLGKKKGEEKRNSGKVDWGYPKSYQANQ